MFSNFIVNSKKKFQSRSKAQALISFTALAILLSSLKAYGMDLPNLSDDDAETHWIMWYKHARGKAEDKNEEKAMQHLQRAADLGHAKANFKLGRFYEFEANDDDLAYKFYHIAADKGYAKAQFELGLGYFGGIFLEKDTAKGLKYLKLAATQGYFKLAANQGQEANSAVDTANADGSGIPQNRGIIFQHCEFAANLGIKEAKFAVGNAYATGAGVPKDPGMAFQYYKFASKQGHAEATVSVGNAYYYGVGIKQNFGEALQHYKLAAEQGHVNAQFTMGEMWDAGEISHAMYNKEKIKSNEDDGKLGRELALAATLGATLGTGPDRISLRHPSKPKASAPTSNSAS